MNWVITLAALIIVGFLLDREIYFYEGVHLGPRVQAWLYDRWAKKYDAGKRASQLHDDQILAAPLLEALKDVPEPLLLDFATGTGRLSYVLLQRPEFRGHIIALDLSQGMLEQAAVKLRGHLGRVELLRHLYPSRTRRSTRSAPWRCSSSFQTWRSPCASWRVCYARAESCSARAAPKSQAGGQG